MEDETSNLNNNKVLSSQVDVDKKIRLKRQYTEVFKSNSSSDILSGTFSEHGEISTKVEYQVLLDDAFNKISPLIYLTTEQRKNFRKNIFFI